MSSTSRTVSVELRWLRAGLVALVAAGLGAFAHVAAGGRLPTAPEIVMLVALLVGASAAVLGRPAGYRRLLVLVGGGQAVMHFALTATAGHGGSGTPHHGGSGPVGPHHTTHGGSTGPTLVEHLVSEVGGANLVMTLTHLVAAAGVAAWLFLGEQALWALVALLGVHVVGRLLAAAALLGVGADHPRPRPTALRTADHRRPPRQHRFATNGPTGRRGPPVARLLPSPTT